MGLFGNRKLDYMVSQPLSFRNDEDINEPTAAYDLGTDTAVPSTAIEEARYDGNDMRIKFKNGDGTEYTYPNVPLNVAQRFRYATSYGRAFNEDIKPYSVNQ